MAASKKTTVWEYVKSSLQLKRLILHITYFFSGLFISDSTLFLRYSPLGVAYISVVPMQYMISSVIGTSLGYLILSPVTGVYRYICSVIAVASIRFTLSDLKRINESRIFSPVLAFVPLFMTGVVLRLSGNINSYNLVICISESLLAAAGAYFFGRTCDILNRRNALSSLSPAEVSCLAISAGALLMSVTSITVYGISLGRVAACVLIMLCAYYGRVIGGSIAGTCTGLVFSLASPIYGYLAGAYAFSGLISGIFAYGNKIFAAVSFAAVCFVMSFQSAMTDIITATAYETAIAALVFLFMPKRAGVFFTGLFPVTGKGESAQGLRRAMLMRLDFASKALADVSCSVDSVSERLDKLDSNTPLSVCDNAAADVCGRCGMKHFCWEKFADETKNDFICALAPLEQKGRINAEDLSDTLTKKCIKKGELVESFNHCYERYLMCETAKKRLDEVRTVVSGQFSGLSEILRDMHNEYKNYESFDLDTSERIEIRLKELGINPLDVSCRIDKFGRMNIEIETDAHDRSIVKRASLLHEISKACGRKLDAPQITDAPERCRFQLTELPNYDTEIGVAQHICGNGQLCGDSVTFFNDGCGRLIGIIGDGMGTGPRAAIDGSMATGIMSKLIRAGLGVDCSIRTVNSALLVKSGDESLSTIDMISIDLFSGETDFVKAGGCYSYVRRCGRLAKIEMESLPLGILPELKTGKKTVGLLADDVVVMISDGAISTGDMWLESLLKCWDERPAQELASAIVNEAVAHRNDGRDDDITALVIRLTDAA